MIESDNLMNFSCNYEYRYFKGFIGVRSENYLHLGLEVKISGIIDVLILN